MMIQPMIDSTNKLTQPITDLPNDDPTYGQIQPMMMQP